jgi:hypothetical protein
MGCVSIPAYIIQPSSNIRVHSDAPVLEYEGLILARTNKRRKLVGRIFFSWKAG